MQPRAPLASFASSLVLTVSTVALAVACSSSDEVKSPATPSPSTSVGATSSTTSAAGTGGTTGGSSTAGSSSTQSVTSGTASSVTTTATSSTTGANTTSGDVSTGAGGTTTGDVSSNGASTGAASTGGVSTSTGCGAASWPEAGMQSLEVDGVTREFISGVPDAYDGTTPQRLVFAFHGRTGTAQQIAGGFNGGYYGLENRMTDTIFVAPQGLGTDEDPADTGWPDTNGQDIAFVEAMLDYFESNYCIDSSRIYSTGFSYGGIMSNTIACRLGSRFRAVAPMAGALFAFGQNACLSEPVAAWFTHGTNDDQVAFEQGQSARDAILERNGCDANTTEPVDPSPCVSYQNCLEGYPVHWCETDLTHMIPDFAADAVANFFLSF